MWDTHNKVINPPNNPKLGTDFLDVLLDGGILLFSG